MSTENNNNFLKPPIDYGYSKISFYYSLKWRVYASIKLSILYQEIDEHLIPELALKSVYKTFSELKEILINEGYRRRIFSIKIINFLNNDLRVFLAKWDKKNKMPANLFEDKDAIEEFKKDLDIIQKKSKDFANKIYEGNIWLKKYL